MVARDRFALRLFREKSGSCKLSKKNFCVVAATRRMYWRLFVAGLLIY
jgi:hypothetical protein